MMGSQKDRNRMIILFLIRLLSGQFPILFCDPILFLSFCYLFSVFSCENIFVK